MTKRNIDKAMELLSMQLLEHIETLNQRGIESTIHQLQQLSNIRGSIMYS